MRQLAIGAVMACCLFGCVRTVVDTMRVRDALHLSDQDTGRLVVLTGVFDNRFEDWRLVEDVSELSHFDRKMSIGVDCALTRQVLVVLQKPELAEAKRQLDQVSFGDLGFSRPPDHLDTRGLHRQSVDIKGVIYVSRDDAESLLRICPISIEKSH